MEPDHDGGNRKINDEHVLEILDRSPRKNYHIQMILGAQHFYDLHGLAYDSKRKNGQSLYNEGIEMPATKKILRSLHLKDKNILDLGCGTGAYSNFLLQQGAKVTALDISHTMLELTAEKCAKNRKSLTLVQGTLGTKQLPHSPYDIILGSFMLGYIDDLDSHFSSVAQHLAPQGTALFSGLHPLKTVSHMREDSYCITKNYHTEKNHISDIGLEKDVISLHRWTMREVTSAAKKHHLFLDTLSEPKPTKKALKYYADAEIFMHIPSVILYVFKNQNDPVVNKV